MALNIEEVDVYVKERGITTNKNFTIGGGGNFDMSGSTGTFKLPTGAITFGGNITLAANENITAVAGTTALDLSLGTGIFKTSTGTNTLGGNTVLSGASTFTAGTGAIRLDLGPVTQKQNVISGSGATVTLTAAQSGSLVLFDRAAGIIFTLPAPAVGMWFDFAVAVTITSNNAKVITDTGTTLLAGFVGSGVDNTANKQWVGNGSTHIAVTQNGTTTGGILGSWLRFMCTTSTQWVVTGSLVASGTPATPFATS
jgi:hypothetical protein